MKNNNFIILIFCFILSISCSDKNDKFPLDKRFWTTDDYSSVILELRYGYKDDEKLPTFDDIETQKIVQKFVDTENFKVILNDKELGTKYKNEVAVAFFDKWKEMIDIYSGLDKKDKYIYEEEFLETYKFGLELQLFYFRLGNEEILNGSDDPNSDYIQNLIKSNVNTMVDNYSYYLDQINNEEAFSENGKKLYAESINTYFTKLIDENPASNYESLKEKIILMDTKSKSEVVKTALKNILSKIESLKTI